MINSFFHEIIERRVLQFCGIYLATSWAIIEFISWLANAYSLSPSLPKFILVLLGSLLPSIILLSYLYGKPGRDKITKIEKIGIPTNLALSAFLLFFLFHGRSLGATKDIINIKDDKGNIVARSVVRSEFLKKIAIFPLQNISKIPQSEWMRIGIPTLLQYDLNQDNYFFTRSIFDYKEKINETGIPLQSNIPLSLQLKLAKESNLDFLLNGNFKILNNKPEYIINLYKTTGKLIATEHYSGKNIFETIDDISIFLKKKLELPKGHLEATPDLPVAEIVTSSLDAFKYYTNAISIYNFENNIDESIELTRKAIKKDSLFMYAYSHLCGLMFAKSNVNEAKMILNKVMDNIYMLSERDQFIWKRAYYIVNGQSDKALEVLKTGAEIYPDDIAIHEALFSYYSRWSKKLDLAIIELKKLLQLDPSGINRLHELGDLYKRTNKYDEALDCYNKFIQLKPENAFAYEKVGNLYLDMGQFIKAKEYFEKAALLEPENSYRILKLANYYKRIADFANAEIKLAEALKFSKTDQQKRFIFSSFADMYAQQGQIKKALEFLDKELAEMKKTEDPITCIHQLASNLSLLSQIGKADIALKEIDKLKVEPPHNGDIIINKLDVYIQIEDFKSAEKEKQNLENMLTAFHVMEPSIYYFRGRVCEGEKDFDCALKNYTEYLKNSPENFYVKLRIAVCYNELKKHKQAASMIEEIIKLYPSNAYFLYNLALVYTDLGEKTKAEETLKKTLQILSKADEEYILAQKARQKWNELKVI